MRCPHTTLQLSPSPFAQLAGYERGDQKTLAAAEVKSGRPPKTLHDTSGQLFPAPLVLPHDDLNYDPDCPPQSLKSWLSMKSRNKLNTEPKRNTLYVAQIPTIEKEVGYMHDWLAPRSTSDREIVGGSEINEVERLDVKFFADYLKSFYLGINVEICPTPLSWVAWAKQRQGRPSRSVKLPQYIGLAYDGRCTRIRVRPTPDHVFTAQLSLDDILDAAIDMLPEDAYAICLVIDHDMYENEEDDFCCGRAYGGSRVAVVQSARYNPALDKNSGIDHEHMWPRSHCKAYVDKLCAVEEVKRKPPSSEQITTSKNGPMRMAIDGASQSPVIPYAPQDIQSLWFSRLARTITHELGHCFGMAHCAYYACNMQGTASMKEDVRQPPYLCPICEAKVAHAVVEELILKKGEVRVRCGRGCTVGWRRESKDLNSCTRN
ncbi:hypothetical protein IQ07DRAFT_625888 [Pyrenochaeta sp. DS3sAY3a]|nr:hypothetical protein IQ07DRAFT_625888 [Pyrenochaeta sp. DS3sAY3a]